MLTLMRHHRTIYMPSLSAVCLFAIAVIAWRFLFGCILDGETIAELESGDSDDVIRVLGQPSAIHNDRTWIYAPFPNQGWVSIAFDDQGNVLSVNDESVFPCH